jgi:hypothetical protein
MNSLLATATKSTTDCDERSEKDTGRAHEDLNEMSTHVSKSVEIMMCMELIMVQKHVVVTPKILIKLSYI